MTLPVFPNFRWPGWPVKRTPNFDTLVQKASSGKETRLTYYNYPIWTWEFTYGGGNDDTGFLPDDPNNLLPGNPDTDLITIQGFFLQMQGKFGMFLLDVDGDDEVEGQVIGTGDGFKTEFQLIRERGGFSEPVQAPFTDPPPDIYVAGALKTAGSDYAISNPGGLVTFVIPPVLGAPITVDMSYYWIVRFDDDATEYENFMVNLWQLKSLKLRQVLL